MIHELTEKYKIGDILKATNFPKSTYYDWLKRKNKENPDQKLEDLVSVIFKESNETYGYRRIKLAINVNKEHYKYEGADVSNKKIYNIMKRLGIICIKFTHKNRKYNSYKGTVGKVAKNKINRRFKTAIPYQKLTTDITEFKLNDGTKLYLSPILDMATNEVISFSMNSRPNVEFVRKSLEKAIPIIKENAIYRTTIHSDQGMHYQHFSWINTLKKNKIFQSMSRKGNCLDNSPMESFFGILKQEMYHGKYFSNYRELEAAITEYIQYYNCIRIKLRFNGLSPVQYRIQTIKKDSLLAV